MSFMYVSDSRITEKSLGSTSKGNVAPDIAFIRWALDQMLQVRQLEQGDAPAVQRLYERAVRRAEWLPAAVKADPNFARASQGEAVFVYHSTEGRLVGLLSVYVPESYIHHVFVDPEFERRGVGTVLLSSLETWLPLPWRLKCVTANAPARAFYASHGWIEVGSGNSDQGPYVLLERRSEPDPDASPTTGRVI
ncbi:MAG: GNAT family N-acetyltransferase [Betaproteobacteria bacterium]|nr:MAG: GNAT family N-acetyltransferase [Betaproteobacteria bacterium]